jgi:methylated-DNA-[protein]-cysteine S-methyltransferase
MTSITLEIQAIPYEFSNSDDAIPNSATPEFCFLFPHFHVRKRRDTPPVSNHGHAMQVLKYFYVYDSPVGPLQLVSDGSSLIGLYFGDRTRAAASADDPTVNPFPETIEQLEKYFGGSLEEFNLPILLHGTEFQVRAWNELRNIPYGETISYKIQAEKIGSVPRAVGLANGQNPVSIIVPCHRVIGADGSLVGYGGGLNRKRALLQFEATVRDFGPQAFDALSLAHGKPARRMP